MEPNFEKFCDELDPDLLPEDEPNGQRIDESKGHLLDQFTGQDIADLPDDLFDLYVDCLMNDERLNNIKFQENS